MKLRVQFEVLCTECAAFCAAVVGNRCFDRVFAEEFESCPRHLNPTVAKFVTVGFFRALSQRHPAVSPAFAPCCDTRRHLSGRTPASKETIAIGHSAPDWAALVPKSLVPGRDKALRFRGGWLRAGSFWFSRTG